MPKGGPRQTLATLVRPRSEDLLAICEKRSSVSGERPGLAALVGPRGAVGHFTRRLVPICTRAQAAGVRGVHVSVEI